MPSCIVCGRSDNAIAKATGITFHRFPAKESTRVKWNNFLLVNALNPENVIKTSLVCSLHFDKCCFILHNKKRKLLQKHAVPSIIVGRIKYAKQIYPETLMALTQDVEIDSVSNSIGSTSSTKNALSFNRKLVKISKSDLKVDGVSLLNEPITSNTSCTTSSIIPMTNKIETIETSFIAASEVSNDDTSRRMFLEHGIHQLSREIKIQNEKLRSLQQVLKRQNKKIANLTTIIDDQTYQKLVIRANDVHNLNTENCIEDISSTVSVNVLNKNIHGCISDKVSQDENLIDVNAFIMDHDYIGCQSD
ncbi:Zinc finger, C2CH-type [Cinara cedri]|uniref:Zinc finger, C2CH-type n=1 Tax=Cinara cedri TaxID=506608 RepID=A0A5E4MM05_9HEMI|nr:Zinc finger, C2CH-type [Cinara cedri]